MKNFEYRFPGDDMIIREFRDIENLSCLKNSWDLLTGENCEYKPFLCFDWFVLWLKHFLGNDKLLVVTLFEKENLVAVVPLLEKSEILTGVPIRKIEFVGNVYSPIQTFISNAKTIKERSRQLSFVMRYFSKVKRSWDLMDLNAIPEENDDFGTLKKGFEGNGYTIKTYVSFGNWHTGKINYSNTDFLKRRSRNLRASIKKCKKKAENVGKLEFRMITDPSEVEQYMKIHFDVYSRSWKKRERAGPAFYLDLTKLSAKKGWLRLGLVYLNNEPVATGFAFVCDGFSYFEKTAYDERYKDVGVGTIWLFEMIRYVLDVDGVHSVDVLRGDDEYKKRWMEQRRERKGLMIFNKSVKGNLLGLTYNEVIPRLKKTKLGSILCESVTKKVRARH